MVADTTESRVNLSGICLPDELTWRKYLAGLAAHLEANVMGQENASRRIARAVQAAELGLNAASSRPKASFLFLGPTGVGKTESAKVFTRYLFGGHSALEMLFMNEYSTATRHGEFLERLETAVRRNPSGATLLFDEVEKAHPHLIDLFLSLLDEGEFTTCSGTRLSVRHWYLVLTSNLGSSDLAKMESALYATMERVALDVASQSLRPELFARIGERIVFRPLDLQVQKQILEKLVAGKVASLGCYFQRRLTVERGPVMAFLLRSAYSRAQGARLLRQEVERQFNHACLPWALSCRPPVDGHFVVDGSGGGLVLR
ncbi:MAG TPA: AAA family ATPase [Chthoniobacterales bacterium]